MRYVPRTPYERAVMLWYRNMSAVAHELRALAEDAGHVVCAAYVGPGPPRKPGKHKLGVLWRHAEYRNYQFMNVGDTYVFPTPVLTTCPTVCVVGANCPDFKLTSDTTNYHVLEVIKRCREGRPPAPRLRVLCSVDEARAVALTLFDWMTSSYVHRTRWAVCRMPMAGTYGDLSAAFPEFRTARAEHLIRGWRRQAATIDLQAALSRTL